jgi:hypothetical protein
MVCKKCGNMLGQGMNICPKCNTFNDPKGNDNNYKENNERIMPTIMQDKLNSTPGSYGKNFGVEASMKSYEEKQKEKGNLDYIKTLIPYLIIFGIVIFLIFLIVASR